MTHADIRQHGRKSAAGAALLCLLMLLAQSSSLTHAHDGDLERHSDCETCLKFGADDEAAVTADTALPWRPAAGPALESGRDFTPLPLLAPRSRSPPPVDSN